ncbi:MAG TPA: LysM peptidoglycan-binding domain-containing protein, partial [Chitinophagales bacterium]|nr:LysM peptidoglycan-binding domain-containing protein [Chitinophagales bacterium]
ERNRHPNLKLWEEWANDPETIQQSNQLTTGDEKWQLAEAESLLTNPKSVPKKWLRTHLVDEQKHNCCYCEKQISDDEKTIMEHLNPKSKYTDKVFDYENLLASCNGGVVTQETHIVVKNNETLQTIAQERRTTVEELKNLNRHYRKRDEHEIFRCGDKIHISEKPKKHCDAQKKADEILLQPIANDGLLYPEQPKGDANPYLYSCGQRMYVEETDGSIDITETFKNTITVAAQEQINLAIKEYLNLNAPALKKARLEAFETAKVILNIIKEDYPQNVVNCIAEEIKNLQNNTRPYKTTIIQYLQTALNNFAS